MAANTACCAGSSSLLEISFSALAKWVLVALLTDLFRSCFLPAARAAFSADLLLGNPVSFFLYILYDFSVAILPHPFSGRFSLRTKAGFSLADSCSAYNTTYTLDSGEYLS